FPQIDDHPQRPMRRRIDAYYPTYHSDPVVNRQLATAWIRARWLGLLSRRRIAGGNNSRVSALARLRRRRITRYSRCPASAFFNAYADSLVPPPLCACEKLRNLSH